MEKWMVWLCVWRSYLMCDNNIKGGIMWGVVFCLSWKKTPVISWLLSFYSLIITIPNFQHPVLPWQECWDIHTKICSGSVQETRKKKSQVKPSNSQLSFWRINRNKLKLQKLQTTSHTTQRICCQFLSVRLQMISPCLVLSLELFL